VGERYLKMQSFKIGVREEMKYEKITAALMLSFPDGY